MPGSPRSAAAAVRDELHAAGIVLRLEDGALRYSAPPGALTEELRRSVRACRDALIGLLGEPDGAPRGPGAPDSRAEDSWHFAADPGSAGAAFPLTDLQQAYLIGEQDFYDHPAPAVFVHEYAFAAGTFPDADTLHAALTLLRRAHGALRLAVFENGTQRILPVPAGGEEPGLVDRHDLTGLSGEAARAELLALRERLAGDLPPYAEGRPFLLRHVLLPDGTARIQIALRLIAFDGVTTQLFFTELARCCVEPDYLPDTLGLTFRDYVRGLEERRASGAHHSALRYWERRADMLPPAPALPARPAADPAADPTADPCPGAPLRRLSTRLDAPSWARFRAHAAAAGLPVGSALFALFTEALHRWSDGAAGAVTVLAAHRPGSHPELPRVWGNASTTVLVGYGPDEAGLSFADRCRRLQGGLYADLSALEVSGVEVSRSLQKRRAETGSPAPVVFTSGLDLVDGAPGGFLLPLPGAELVHSSISTPQILLDHQVYEEDGELVCNLDHAESAYPPGLIEELAAYHRRRLRALADDGAEWAATGPVPLPAAQLAGRVRANDTATPLPTGELHSFALRSCRTLPEAPAVHDGEGTLSRAGLDAASAALADRLRELGIGRNPDRPELVGVRVPRGRAQSVAVLAVLRAGGAYVPIDPHWPDARVRTVLRHSGARALVTGAELGTPGELPEGVHQVVIGRSPGPDAPGEPAPPLPGAAEPPAGGSLDRSAYVIYTSGSTGTPKGVVIPHRAAVNTLCDLAERFSLTPDDKVLAVSSLAFDLSVFDQFAVLGCGGSVVCPPQSAVPDPQSWGECVRRHGVTVWNSVPALLALTLEYLGEQARELLASLRLVMLSGDWVPLPLLDRLAAYCPGAQVIAMGGATEASIWSNWYPVTGVPAGWQSVPYGTPLANQTMHVLDRNMADVPDWVPGDLYIGGAGLATGYLGEPERTAASFPRHPVTGERLYRTGDRARYRPGGILEFLGRADHQVKINGYRVELGEIEAQLSGLAGVGSSVALVDTSHSQPYLAAFITRDEPAAAPQRARIAPDAPGLLRELGDALPPYMVPATVVEVPGLPLSGNGKVDRKALLALLADTVRAAPAAGAPDAAGGGAQRPGSPVEARLLALWQDLLGPAASGVTDDFFTLGGSSLTAVRLFRSIETAFGRRLPLASLFRSRTVRAQAALLTAGDGTATGDDTGPLVGLGGDGGQHVVFVHPVGGDVLCYEEAVSAMTADPELAPRISLHGLRAAGLHGAEEPASSLDAMAKHYAHTLAERLPDGPLHLVGWSLGGTVALHTAVLLEREGRPVASLTTIDSFVGRPDGCAPAAGVRLAGFFGDLLGRGDLAARLPDAGPDASDEERLLAAHDALFAQGLIGRALEPAELSRLFAVYRNNAEILERHTPVAWHPGPAAEPPAPDGPPPRLSIRAGRTSRHAFPGLLPLDEVVADPGPVLTVDEDHFSVVRAAAAARLARRIGALCAAAPTTDRPRGARE
ncbi:MULTISPECIES: non-ribosomal peptide synthetase [unclassified Streptomyces]|uniref:non-ribosomal peptide synthetase n=1 Tax=unclassified Streptomyces TaxID=2593676 RepID=UPI000DAD5AAB|nr:MULTISPECIES: non-ribosomal peptide synthetase [unclassified Streptomyces]PZT76135.1 non-ribosomal peptide synthetase [Streptomyces sp. AC1-42W]PZT79913.1 non-ribosomal peptide synthetase [Streptomyces sp. AC1-42T]